MMTPSVNSHVNFDTAPIIVDISEYQEFVFLLGRLWKITLSTIEIYWILNLFAVGLFDEGKKVIFGAFFCVCACKLSQKYLTY